MSKAKNDKYYSKITWREVECPRCKGKGSIENFIYSTYYVNTTAASTDGGISTIETCNVCNGYKIIRHKVLEFKKYTEFNKFDIIDI